MKIAQGDNMGQEERKKKRARKRKIRLAFVAFVFIYLLLRSIPSLGYKTKLPEKHTIYKKIESEGVIIKDEKVFTAYGEGKLKLYVKEGQRVPVGKKIAEIYLLDSSSTLEQKLDEIDERIGVLSQVEGEKLSSTTDKVEIEDSLNTVVEEIQESISNGDYSRASLLKDKLSMYNDKQKDITGDNTLVDTSLDNLKKERESIKNQIISNMVSYHSDQSGILSFKIDGYEDKFTFDNRENYKYKDFERLSSELKTVSNNQNVKVGDPIFKIIDNLEWYMLIKADNIKDLEDYQEGSQIILSGKDIEQELKGRIVKINKDGDKAAILCRFNRDFHYYYDKRVLDIDIILARYESYKIPKKSITELDGVKGVYIRDASGIVRFRPVEVLDEDKDYSYINIGDKNGNISLGKDSEQVKTVSQFDEILLNPTKVEEGMIIN
ncbi:MAG: hypothetical protein GX080_04460 [Tissierellia bacterium]|nr:hypothetical protein [Tissierellia bacterium]